jgi:hypothetical protein
MQSSLGSSSGRSSLPGAASALAALVAPLPARQFLREYWPERSYSAHGPLSRLPAVFSSRELSSFRSLVSNYQGWLGFGRGAQGGRMISVQQVNPAHLYEMGLSIYLPDIAPGVPGADAFLRALESELGVGPGCARMTVWASPQGDGAPTHFDGEDVFSVQLAGTKRWELAPMREYSFPVGPQYGPGAPITDDMYPQLERGFPDADTAEFRAVDMKPGSVLFVPRGTWHRTAADQDSFAISIGINPPCLADSYLEQLRCLLLQDPEWRRPLYGVRGESGQLQEGALARTQRILETAARATRAISARDLVPTPEAERLHNMDRGTRFQRQAGARMIFEQGPGAELVEIRVSGANTGERATLKMNVPPEYSAVFRWLSESRVAFSAGELADRFADVPFEQLRKMLDVLARGQYLRLLWFPQLPRT